ncbi:hypothetical protein [Sodalis-like endosymbiont of Proechinophthirus fluctus]
MGCSSGQLLADIISARVLNIRYDDLYVALYALEFSAIAVAQRI